MNFTRIYNVTELKVGDKVAVISGDESFAELLGSNINMTTGVVTEKNHMSVLVKTNTTNLVISNILLKIQTLYLITDAIKDMAVNTTKPGYTYLNRRLRKAEKLNKRYEAIFEQKFNISKEELKSNLKAIKKPKTREKYYAYKSLDMEIPYLLNGKLINISAICNFKRAFDNDDEVVCVITAYYDGRQVATGEGKATCHPDDQFNREVGELISSTKALNDITQKLY